MTNILFWNTYRNSNINHILINAILENNCDIVILAEYINNINGLCNELSLYKKDFKPFITNCDRIKIIADFEYEQDIIFDNHYATIKNIKTFDKEFLITALHLPGKLHNSDDNQRAVIHEILTEMERAISEVRHNNVVIVGDFNANPFEKVCINADCFHAVPNKNKAFEKTRTVNFKEYPMYCNPMWNLFGDSNITSGTYYYPDSGIQTYFWNIFDQVILSPEIAKIFDSESLKIISGVNDTLLLNNKGIPNNKISDHLPIFFQIREELL